MAAREDRIQFVSHEDRYAFGSIVKRELKRIGITQAPLGAALDVKGPRMSQLLGADLLDLEQFQRVLRAIPDDEARIAIHAAFVRHCVPLFIDPVADATLALATASRLDRAGLPARAVAHLGPALRNAPRELLGKLAEKVVRLDLRLTRAGRASEVILAAEREVRPSRATYEDARFHHVRAAILQRSGALRAALSPLVRALESARASEDERASRRIAEILCDEARIRLECSVPGIDPSRAVELASEALKTFDGGRPAVLARIVLARVAASHRRSSETDIYLDEAEARAADDPELRLELSLARAWIAEEMDGVDAAVDRYRMISREANAVGDVHHRNIAEARRAELLLSTLREH